MVKMRMIQDRVLLKAEKPAEKTAGGLFIPENAQKKMCEGEVMAVGPGRVMESGEVIAPTVKVGDIVLLTEYGGTEVDLDGEKFLIVREDDILGVKEST